MKYWLLPVLALVLLFFGPGNYWSATWLAKWFLLMALGCGGLSIWVARQTSWWHLPLLLYAFGSLLFLAAWPETPYQGLVDAVTLLALQKNAFAGIAELVAAAAFLGFLCARPVYLRSAPLALCLLWATGVGGILHLPVGGPGNAADNGLWFGNPSMGASLLACLLPFVWAAWRNKLFLAATWGLTLLAIYRTGASVPWGVLGAVTAATLLCARPRLGWLIPPLALAMVALGWRCLGADFWQNTGRFEIWRMAWDWFRSHGSLPVGMGFSSSQILLPLEQTVTGHYHGAYFLWMHNDWLQLLIEGGVIGAVCAAVSFGRLVLRAYSKPPLFGALVGFAVLGVFNYPLRMPLHCFCLVLLLGLIEGSTPAQSPARFAKTRHRTESSSDIPVLAGT